jgi:hypothetical protein
MHPALSCLIRTVSAFLVFSSSCSTVTLPPKRGRQARQKLVSASAEAVLPYDEMQKVLSGMLALVEAQHTYYVHVTHNTKFATDIRELGSVDEPGGTVIVREVWNANADSPKSPLAGYYFKILPYANNSGEKDGFAVVAVAGQTDATLPAFLTVVNSAKGGILGMCSADTWMVRDMSLLKQLRKVLQEQAKLDAATVSPYAPSASNRTRLVSQFSATAPL